MMELVASEFPLSFAIPAVPAIVTNSIAWREEVMPSRPITIPKALMQSPKSEENKEPFFFPILGDRKKKGKQKMEAGMRI
jgi:hypothetical protein